MSALCFIIFTEILCSLFWYFKMKQRFSWIEMFAISRSIPTNIKHFKFRGLLGIYIAYCMIINNIFQSSLVKSFGTVQESYDMKTLEEFTQTSYTIHTSYVNIFRNVDTDTFKKLQTKIVDTSTSNEWALYRVAEERSFACLERRSDSKYFIATRFLDRSGYPKLHVIDECPGNYLLAFALQLKSPYLKEFNNVLKRLMEGGFIKKWHAAPAESVLAIITIQKERNVYKPLTSTDIQITFFILIAGYLAGVVTLTVELFCCNIIKKKE